MITIGDTRIWMVKNPGRKVLMSFSGSEWSASVMDVDGSVLTTGTSSVDLDTAVDEAIMKLDSHV